LYSFSLFHVHFLRPRKSIGDKKAEKMIRSVE
jgi:hypothetical protein